MDGSKNFEIYARNTPKIREQPTSTPPKSIPKPSKIEPKTLQNRGLEGVPLEIAFRSQIEPLIFRSWGAPGGVFGASCGVFGASAGVSGASRSVLGASGRVLAASWSILEASWGVWNASWSVLGASWSVLAASWRRLGASWARLGAFQDPKEVARCRAAALLGRQEPPNIFEERNLTCREPTDSLQITCVWTQTRSWAPSGPVRIQSAAKLRTRHRAACLITS